MSKGTLGQVVKRAISDAAFRRQLKSDPEGALKGFDLTGEERAALRSGDAQKLSTFGIDQRMSKAFAIGEVAASRGAFSSELSDSTAARAAFVDSDAGGARAADAERLAQVNAAFDGADSAAGRNALGDQHDGGRAAIGDCPAGGARSALTDADRLGQVNAAFEGGDAAGGRSALDNSGTASREGTASITADEAGRDASPATLASSDSAATSAFITADEAGNDVVGGSASAQSATSSDAAGRQTDAFMTADEMGNDVSASGPSHPSLSADQRLAGETLEADIIPADSAADPWAENPEHQG